MNIPTGSADQLHESPPEDERNQDCLVMRVSGCLVAMLRALNIP